MTALNPESLRKAAEAYAEAAGTPSRWCNVTMQVVGMLSYNPTAGIEAAIASYLAAEVEPWQLIETAPQDGTLVWVYVAAAHGLPAFQSVCAYHLDGGWCCDELRAVTHWKPLRSVWHAPPTGAAP